MEDLYVVFTMECRVPSLKAQFDAPQTWEQSARSIDGFCTLMLNNGFAVTLLASPECAEEQSPLLEEFWGKRVEVGLYVDPPSIRGSKYKRDLGTYGVDEQRDIIEESMHRFADALGRRPRSFRAAQFSASDATYQLLYNLGFTQGSLSSPGRNLPRRSAVWVDAPNFPHYVDPHNRLKVGSLEFLEIPLSTMREGRTLYAGMVPELVIESGDFELVHKPIIDALLASLESEGAEFKAICATTSNHVDYRSDTKVVKSVETMINYLQNLEDRYRIIPTTMITLHERYREYYLEKSRADG